MATTSSTGARTNGGGSGIGGGNIPTVYLLLSSEEMRPLAQLVSDALFRRFGLADVVIRYANAPSDVLLRAGDGGIGSSSSSCAGDQQQPAVPPPSVLYVVLGSSSTASTSVLESEGHAPIISLPSSDEPAKTALSIARCCSLACPDLRLKVKSVVFEERQARLVGDAQLRTQSFKYASAISTCYDGNAMITGDQVQVVAGGAGGGGGGVERKRGKVRDRYVSASNNRIALLTTDRQSGFDRQLALVPHKGAVLNLTSAYWFETTRHIIPNHLLSIPHPNVCIVKKCQPFPIEFVVRYVAMNAGEYSCFAAFFVSGMLLP